MISLSPGSLCDVCAEEYGPHNYPHSIPCGHILCLHCCNNILEKTSPRLTPSCPFCRVPFTSDTIRLIRVDYGSYGSSGSGWSTPRATEGPDVGILAAGDDDVLLFTGDKDRDKTRVQLESKVARVASKKCSVEEVKHLHQELRKWLTMDKKRDEQTAALELSAALLHAILVNHVAHKHASEMAKQVENNLRDKLAEVQTAKDELEQDLHRMQTQASARAAEIQALRAELGRYKIKAAAPALGVPATPPATSLASSQSGMISPPRPQTAFTPSRSRATSPTSPTPSPARAAYVPAVASPLARINSASAATHGHSRSASAIPMHRSMTPAARPTSAIPAPAHPIPHTTAKPRLSSPPPATKMFRSTSSSSDEKEKETRRHMQHVEFMERWIPKMNVASTSPPTGPPTRWPHLGSGNHASLVPPPRYKTPLSVHSP